MLEDFSLNTVFVLKKGNEAPGRTRVRLRGDRLFHLQTRLGALPGHRCWLLWPPGRQRRCEWGWRSPSSPLRAEWRSRWDALDLARHPGYGGSGAKLSYLLPFGDMFWSMLKLDAVNIMKAHNWGLVLVVWVFIAVRIGLVFQFS
jgi:hypothetical protein